MKRIFKFGSLVLLMVLTLTGCGSKKTNLTYSASEIIDKVYEGINADEMPRSLETTEVTSDAVTYYIGTDKVDYKEIYASEPMMSSVAYSVVVVKLNEGADVEEAKKLIKDNVDPRKWICVDAEIVTVDNVGDTIILIMMDEQNEELAKKIQNNFKNLK